MTLASKLALPTLFGGLVALIASGVLAPPVQAKGYDMDTIARITGVADWDHLNVRKWPAHYSQKIGAFEPHTWVWIERCIEVENSSDWCLVERAETKGWVNARFLTPYWE